MLTLLPNVAVVIVYLLAALLPMFLMRYIYRKDTIEKEPKGMLVGLVFLGVAAAVVAVIFETLGTNLLSNYLSADDPAYTIVLAFLVVAVVEEGAKYLFLVWRAHGATQTSTIVLTELSTQCLFRWASLRLKTSAT